MTTPRVPVLMYHKVGATVDGVADTFINVSTRNFSRQIRFLHRRGYQGITFVDAVRGLTGERALPPRSYVVTFDDGYSCVGEHAVPILAKYNVPATVFVVSDGAGKCNEWDRLTGKPILPLMDWEELKRLCAAGWEIAGHTKTHPHMDRLDDDEALRELIEGKQATESEIGKPLDTFCYPFGDYGKQTPHLVMRAGYIGACTTRSGIARNGTSPFIIPRIKISHSDSVAGLLYKLIVRPVLPTMRMSDIKRARLSRASS